MLRVLLTGVSGVGKSTIITRLAARGYQSVDTDYDGWCAPGPDTEPPKLTAEPGWVWREDRMRRLLETTDAEALFVSGCVPNQAKFYHRFDHIVLLSAPAEVIRQRLRTRVGNAYGKTPNELANVLRDQQEIEPLLRSGATFEIDTTPPIEEVMRRLLAHSGLNSGSDRSV
jgi:broad-specificity NMP kinase